MNYVLWVLLILTIVGFVTVIRAFMLITRRGWDTGLAVALLCFLLADGALIWSFGWAIGLLNLAFLATILALVVLLIVVTSRGGWRGSNAH